MVIRGALQCEKSGREWIAFPAREWTDRAGNRKFSTILEFTDRATAGRFQGAALAAVHGSPKPHDGSRKHLAAAAL